MVFDIMLTSKSPPKVMRLAYVLARDCLPVYACKFARRDFTLPQLCACLGHQAARPRHGDTQRSEVETQTP